MRGVRLVAVVLVAVAALVSACGEDDDPATPAAAPSATPQPTTGSAGTGTRQPDGTRVTLRPSEFGTMLFGPERQAIYVFEKDREDGSVCYGECAEAWPPVLTDGDPVAGKGLRPGLLGTVKRRDGERQVTYAGKPLYYYAHEGPGEVRCHNVQLNGGFWWVVGPDGRRRA